jgi:muramoyltetrapeptide carboxypeptidase
MPRQSRSKARLSRRALLGLGTLLAAPAVSTGQQATARPGIHPRATGESTAPRGVAAATSAPLARPRRLREGDTVGLIDPASATWDPLDIDIVEESLAALGLKSRRGKHLLDRRGYFAGRDEDRAADVMTMFRDPAIAAILPVRGGWGCARLLPHLDFDVIGANPKILVGYSDLTALILAVYARTGLVTFHGPNGSSDWNPFNVEHFTRVLLRGEAVTFRNVLDRGDLLAPEENRTSTIAPGVARGRLAGGNLSVLASLVGTAYLPAWKGTILFLEDINEAPYRIDRMLTQLALAGILRSVAGVIVGGCTDCDPDAGFGSLTIPDVLDDHLKPLRVPAWRGAMIGHLDRQFTLPIGAMVEIDATAATIRMLESAVL